MGGRGYAQRGTAMAEEASLSWRPAFHALLLMATAFLPASSLLARRALTVQTYDQSCALASLSTLMRWGGIEASEEQLRAVLLHRYNDPGARARISKGLSSAELIETARLVDPRTQLNPGLATLEQAAWLAHIEPFILLLHDSDDRRNSAVGHFVVIEGFDPARGFLVADPAGGTRTFQTTERLRVKVRGLDGDPRALVLRLTVAGNKVSLEPIEAAERNAIPDFDLRRLIRQGVLLPAGRTAATLSIGGSATAVNIGHGLKVVEDGRTIELELRHALKSGVEFGVAAARQSSRPTLETGDRTRRVLPKQADLSFALNGSLPAKLLNTDGVFSIGASFDSQLRPGSVRLGYRIARTQGPRLLLQAGGDVGVEKANRSWSIVAYPALSAVRPIGKRDILVVDAGVAIGASGHRPALFTTALAFSHRISETVTLHATGQIQRAFDGSDRANRISFGVTVMPPKRLTR